MLFDLCSRLLQRVGIKLILWANALDRREREECPDCGAEIIAGWDCDHCAEKAELDRRVEDAYEDGCARGWREAEDAYR